MKILVTGANGYLGQGVVKALLDNGHSVVAADFKTNYVDAGCFADVQTATARDLFDVASSGSLDKFDGSLVNKRRIHNVISFRGWHSEWNRGLQVHYSFLFSFLFSVLKIGFVHFIHDAVHILRGQLSAGK